MNTNSPTQFALAIDADYGTFKPVTSKNNNIVAAVPDSAASEISNQFKSGEAAAPVLIAVVGSSDLGRGTPVLASFTRNFTIHDRREGFV